MKLVLTEFQDARSFEEYLGNIYESNWVVLGVDNEATRNYYALDVVGAEIIGYGIGVAVAVTGVRPKGIVGGPGVAYVGYDLYINRVSKNASGELEQIPVELDGCFIDAAVVSDNGDVCVVHELGASLFSPDMRRIWSIETDIVSNYAIDSAVGVIAITEMDSGIRTEYSLHGGTKL